MAGRERRGAENEAGIVNEVKGKSTEKGCRDVWCLGEPARPSLSELHGLSGAPKIAQALQSRALLSS